MSLQNRINKAGVPGKNPYRECSPGPKAWHCKDKLPHQTLEEPGFLSSNSGQ